jgi:sugar lactone lactonase YvrE
MRSSPRTRLAAVLLGICLVTPQPSEGKPGNIATYAGAPGEGNALQLGQMPVAVARHGAFIYVADGAFSVVRRIDAVAGFETVVAGNGTFGFSGDGGPAIAAQLKAPAGIALDADGNLYIADSQNNRIRLVHAATGTITTIAGTGFAGFSGDGGPASLAELNAPTGLLVDDRGGLLIADSGNARIRAISEGTIATVVGGGTTGLGDGGNAQSACLSWPTSLAFAPAGGLYTDLLIADIGHNRVRRVSGTTGTITTVAGNGQEAFGGDGGPAAEAKLASPWGVASDGVGNILVADAGNHRIRRIDHVTGVITTIAGTGSRGFSGDNGPPSTAQLAGPAAVLVDAVGDLLIADRGNHRLRKLDVALDLITSVAGNGTPGFAGDEGPATAAQLASPVDVEVDASGDLVIADRDSGRIRRIDGTTEIIDTTAELARPLDVAIDGDGNLFVADGNRVRRVDAVTGAVTTAAGRGGPSFGGDGGPATEAGLSSPSGVALDTTGNLFIADTGNGSVRRVDASTGTISTVADGFVGPTSLAIGAAGDVFVGDYWGYRVWRIDGSSGDVIALAGTGTGGFSGDGGPATAADISNVSKIALDESGNVLLADTSNNRLRKVNAATGVITTVAGVGGSDFSGDGSPAESANLVLPSAVAVRDDGTIYVADRRNHRVRRIERSGTNFYTCYGATRLTVPSGSAFPTRSRSVRDPLALRNYEFTAIASVCAAATRHVASPSFWPVYPDVYLTSYLTAAATTPPQAPFTSVSRTVRDQLGTFALKVLRPTNQLLRSRMHDLGIEDACTMTADCGAGTSCIDGRCLESPLPRMARPRRNLGADNFSCYAVRLKKRSKPYAPDRLVTIEDGIGGSFLYDVMKPTRLCLPADAGSQSPGAEAGTDALLCHKLKRSDSGPSQQAPAGRILAVRDHEFPRHVVVTGQAHELCVPATLAGR